MASSVSQNSAVSHSSRLTFIKPTYYSSKVLVGPWVDKRAVETEIPTEEEARATTYADDFCTKQYTAVSRDIEWDLRMKAEDSNFISPMGKNTKCPSYFENYASMYDLAFNHIPKIIKFYNPTSKLGLPSTQADFLETFGNLTRYGLHEYKQELWKYEKQLARNQKSNYKNDYAPPDVNYYKFKRHGIPLYILK